MAKFDQVHLQWFSDPAEPPAADFPQLPSFDSSYMEDVSVVIEDPAQAAPAPKPGEVEELKKKLEDQQKLIEELKQKGDSAAAIQAGIAGLAQNLRAPAPAAPVVMPQQQPGESDVDFKKRLDEGLLERGVTTTMEEYWARKLRPEVQHLLQSNLVNSRRFVMMDPQRGPLYAKYKTEIEQTVASLPPDAKLYDPEVYEKITDRVAALHATEVIDERVQAAVKLELEKIQQTQAAAQPAAAPVRGAPAVHAEVGQRPAPGAARREVKLTPEEAKYAKDHMIPPHVYADYLQRKGLKK